MGLLLTSRFLYQVSKKNYSQQDIRCQIVGYILEFSEDNKRKTSIQDREGKVFLVNT